MLCCYGSCATRVQPGICMASLARNVKQALILALEAFPLDKTMNVAHSSNCHLAWQAAVGSAA